MSLNAFIRNAADGNDRKSIASGLRRAGRTLQGGDAATTEEQEWMITYTDLVTLLLTLFVILISMSTFEDPGRPLSESLDADEAQAPDLAPLTESIVPFVMPDFGADDDPTLDLAAEPDRPPPGEPVEELVVTKWVDRVEALLQNYLSSSRLVADIEIETVEDRVIVHMRDHVLFPSARADLGDRGREILGKLSPFLRYLNTPITVEGHTDALPIRSTIFASNWELSAARAATVVRVLIELGVARDRLKVVGYADTKPKADNRTAAGRARNRRVSLVLDASKETVADSGRPPVR